MVRQQWSVFLVGLLSGLLSAGLVLLFISRPRRYPIQLHPPPTPAPIQVYITGSVAQPGVYLLPVESILERALEAAGGSNPDADLDRVNLAMTLVDGQQVYIPKKENEVPNPTTPVSQSQAAISVININQAGAAELERLPGIGPSLAEKIVEYRLTHGLFLEVEDLLKVSGIGPAKLDQIRDLIRCQ